MLSSQALPRLEKEMLPVVLVATAWEMRDQGGDDSSGFSLGAAAPSTEIKPPPAPNQEPPCCLL